jgi:ribosomal protein S18 acetylase RimI-like enzyme
MDKNLTFTRSERTVKLTVDGEEVGHIEVADLGGAYYIEDVNIDPQFRGRGFYKMLLIAVFQLFGAEMLVSNNRSDTANFCYEKWTGQELERTQEVTIGLYGEQIEFEA